MGVDVIDLGLRDARLSEGAVEAKGEALALLILPGDVVGVAGRAIANEFAIDTSATGLRMLKVSMTRTPAPSPMTKPSRNLSNGREAFSGVSLKSVDIAFMLQKPA